MTIQLGHVLDWIEELARAFVDSRQLLTELDSAIGDADHGINMDRGFSAVTAALSQASPISIETALKLVAMTLIRTVGGASGPLYGTFFLRASGSCAGVAELDADDLVTLFKAGIEGLQQRGKAEAGDKTMVDALLPALQAMQAALAEGEDLGKLLRLASLAAEKGMRDTIPMIARKGRASYLAERSIGHQDPGATSAYLIIEAAARCLG